MLINKKRLTICFVTIILLITISIYSYGTSKGVITGETVKLRASASLDAKLVTLLSINNKVEVLGQEGDWYKVKYKNDTGYVYKDYIKVTEENNINTTNTNNINDNNTNDVNNETQNNTSQNISQENTKNNIENNVSNNNTVENVNSAENNNKQDEKKENSNKIVIPSEKIIKEDSEIKILPLINSSSISTISKEAKVTVIEYKNGWIYIISSTTSGWIREEKLQENLTSSSTEPNSQGNVPQQVENNTSQNVENNTQSNKEAYVNANSLRVRKEATTSSEIVENLSRNEKVIITGEKDDWYKVTVNNKEGYILKKYLSDKQVTTTSRSMETDRTESTSDINTKETGPKKVNNEKDMTVSSTKTNTKGNEIVEYAKTFLGNKYVSGGSSPKSGFDCSGFTCYVYKKFGYSLNRASSAQAKNGVEVSKSELQLGDLVLFTQGSKNIGHVGIYVGGNNFIHAANAKKGVVITSLSNSYYKANYVTARRIID